MLQLALQMEVEEAVGVVVEGLEVVGKSRCKKLLAIDKKGQKENAFKVKMQLWRCVQPILNHNVLNVITLASTLKSK